jgi:hypothetical protein
MGQGGPQQVRLHRRGHQRPGPLQHPRDDQGGGLVAAGGTEHQDRVAVLGRQQPPEDARGAAQDHPAGLGFPHCEQAQLVSIGPGGGMLGRPCVAGSVAGRPAGQVPQDRGGPAGQAADQAGEAGIHADWAGQRPAHLGRPGQGRVAPMPGQVPQDMGDVGWGDLQPGLAEGQPGGLPGGPDQRAGAGGGAQADGQELVAGAGEWRVVRRAMAARWQGRPGLMLHPSHPPPSARGGARR